MKQSIGIVGLGIMGRGMAANFLKKGFRVYVWNRTAKSADSLVAQGAIQMPSPKEVAKSSDVIFEVTANDESSPLYGHLPTAYWPELTQRKF